MLLEDARQLLSAWRERLVSDQSVVNWADSEIESTPAADLPEWLLDLSTRGPARCMAGPSSEFIEVPFLPFLENFAVRAHMLDLEASYQVETFVEWISRAAMGEDLDVPEVQFGYQVEHLWGDCARMDLAREFVRKELPKLLELRPVPKVLLGLVRAERESAAGRKPAG